MSSTIDPAKLKVVDLRSELSARGLDCKGNKAALVKRLKDALEKELKQDLPDTSIADTSTEDLDTSQTEDKSEETAEEDSVKPHAQENMEVDESKSEVASEKNQTEGDVKSSVSETTPSKPIADKTGAGLTQESKSAKESASTEISKEQQKSEENGEHSEQQKEDKTDEEPSKNAADKKDTSTSVEETEQKGEKRRRTSTSPERSQRRRSRSPIKEDEPALDNDKVQLSWYDSDLHLQLDKESFLSAKPLTDGAFGYTWAGVRATHGVSSGKVCYEVKITEELKWEDFSKHYEQRSNRDRYRTDHRKNQKRDKDKKDHDKKNEDKPKNGEVKDGKSTEKDEKSAEKDEKSTEKDEKSAEKDEKSAEKDEKSAEKDEKSAEKDEKSVEKDEQSAEKEEKSTEKDEKSTEKDEQTTKKDEESTEEKPENEKFNLSDKPDVSDNAPEKMDVDTEKSQDEEKKSEKPEDKSSELDNSAENKNTKDEKMDTDEKKAEASSENIPTHLIRIGWSLITTSLQLGEEKYSYGYESTAKFATDKQFAEYGVSFGVGDVIGSFLAIDEENVTIRYTVNGKIQPVATTIPKSDFPEENFGLFPHVLSRNYAFEFNLGDKEEPWFPLPAELEDYVFLSKVEDKISGPTRPQSRGECEVILMCGLPSSGKTHWVKEHVSSNRDKKYTVLGNTTLLEKMTVSGEPLKSKFKGRWYILVDKLQKCLNKLISLAALRRRNYIIDQTNVFPSAQRRKMRPFEGFKRRAVIVVVGDEEQARRQSLQEALDGKEVPDSTILEMKAAMSLPEKGDWLEEVSYVELQESEAKEIVKKYNTTGKEAGYGSERRFGRRDDKWQNRRNDYHGKSFRERSYHNQRYDPRSPRQGGWSNQRSGGGNWNRDRRNVRGPPAREWRGSGRDHGSRDSRHQGGSYNRPRPQGGNRSQGWSGNNWSGQGWNQQNFGGGGGSGGYGGNQNQWKYGGSGGSSGGQQGYGGGYSNWNYYGQYGQQNWNSQK